MRWKELIKVGWGKIKKKNPAEQNKKRSRVSRDRISVFEIVYAVTPAPCYFFDGGLSCLDRYPPTHGIYRALFPTVKKTSVAVPATQFNRQRHLTRDFRRYFVPSPFGVFIFGVFQDFFRRNDVGRGRKVQIRLLGGTTIKKGKTRTWSSWQPVQSLFLLTSAKVTQ